MIKKRSRSEKHTFKHPTIIGALCAKGEGVTPEINRLISRNFKDIAYLSFEVEKKHLGNTTACMQLMDIAGLTISERYEREIVKHIPNLQTLSRRSGIADMVIRKGRKLVGVNAKGITLMNWIKQRRASERGNKRALIAGKDAMLPLIESTLIAEGWKVQTLGAKRNWSRKETPSLLLMGTLSRKERGKILSIVKILPSPPSLVVNFGGRNTTLKAKRGQNLTKDEFMKRFYHTCVELLTSGL